MAKVYLDASETFTVASSAVVVGNTGSEKLLIANNAAVVTVDQAIERVDLAGNASAYTFQLVGNHVQVRSGTTIVADVTVQSGQILAFADGSAVLNQTSLTNVTLGGTAISTTAAAVVPATFNTSVKSGVTTGGTTPTPTSLALTTGVDNIVGTSGNDTIDGSRLVLSGQNVDTLGSADKIDGGAGTDTLFVQNITANSAISPNTFTNVEVVQIENMAAGTYTLNLANGDSATKTVKVGNTTGGTVTVNNIQTALTNLDLDNITQAVTVASSATAIAGTTDSLAISLNSVTGAAGVSAAGYETVTITSNGTVANAPGRLTDSSLTTLNIAGSQNVTLTLDDGAGTNPASLLTAVNASTATGRVTITLDAHMAQAVAVTGGTGNDTINMNGTYGTTDVINGGAGTDTLTLTNAEAIAATTVQTNVSNVEGISLSDGINGTVTVSNFGATGLTFGANVAGASTINYAAGTNSLTISTFNNEAVTVNVAGIATTDVLNLSVGNATAGTGNTGSAHAYTINGAETVNLSSVGAANTFGAAFSITDTAATQSLIITGNQSLTFTGAVRADVVNASGMTSTAALSIAAGTGTTATTITGTANNDTLTGSTAGDIIAGGAGADTIANVVTGTAATAGDVLTGGAGFDTFVLRGANASGALPSLYNTVAQVTDFTVSATAGSTDILSLSATFGNYTGTSAFFAGIATAAAGSTSIQNVAQNAAATAIVTGTDLIKLTTGVATTGLTAQTAFNAAIGTGTVTGLTASDDIFATFYDTTNSKMVLLVVDANSGTNTIVETGDTVTVVGTIDMSAADYAIFSANSLAIVAA
ncbi:MAG: hypothetical protein V4724_26125 [Pseudomonadota bacterium]